MLSEEEKKAIEIVKEIKNIKFKVTSSFYSNGTISLTIEEKEAIDTVLNLVTRFQKEIDYQKEKRENQKCELAILNDKQKEMNKLINDVKSYKGQFKRQEREIREKDKQIDLMAKYIDNNNYIDSEECQFQYNFKIKKCIEKGDCKECIKQYFEKLAKEKGE